MLHDISKNVHEAVCIKGQHRILMEVMFFAIGLGITSFVVVSFQGVQKDSDSVSIKDQMETVLNNVLNGIVKASAAESSIVRVEIPTVISGRTYKIFVQNGGNLSITDLKDSSINTTRKIFNIDKSYIVQGEAVSSAGIVLITNDGSKIIVQR